MVAPSDQRSRVGGAPERPADGKREPVTRLGHPTYLPNGLWAGRSAVDEAALIRVKAASPRRGRSNRKPRPQPFLISIAGENCL
jgi:hypothetical protein